MCIHDIYIKPDSDREGDELSWCPSWSNSLWRGWNCGLVHCPGGNATDPIGRVLASSWSPLKPLHSNPNPNPLANQLWCSDFFTPPTPLIIPHILPAFLPYRSSKVCSRPDYIFEIHQQWQSDFSRVYSNSCCSCWFEPEIIKTGQSSYRMYGNNILNFWEYKTVLNTCTKSLEAHWMHHVS